MRVKDSVILSQRSEKKIDFAGDEAVEKNAFVVGDCYVHRSV